MKKFILVFCIAALALSLASCRDGSSNCEEKENPAVTENDENNENDINAKEAVNAPKTLMLTLYFPDVDALYLHPETRETELEEGASAPMLVLEQLFAGPVSEGLSPSLDGENLIKSVVVENGLCTVDFTNDFRLLNSGGSTKETFAIGSIVNSLCELEEVEKVKINIEGDTSSEFGGHFTLEAPFTAQMDLVRD